MAENGTLKEQQRLARISDSSPVGNSGLDLLRKANLTEANNPTGSGIDGARLEQMMHEYLGTVNFKKSNLIPLRDALRKANNGELCEIAAISDSGGAGCTSGVAPISFDRLAAWPMSLRDELVRQEFAPDAGTGFVRACDPVKIDERWIEATGGWQFSLLSFAYAAAAGVMTFATDKPGNKVDVYYGDSSASDSFSVSVNGASSGAGFTTVNGATPYGWKKVTLEIPISVGDTVSISQTGGLVSLKGINVYDDSQGGLLVHNLSQPGAKAANVVDSTARDVWSNDSPQRLGEVFNKHTVSDNDPDIVIIALGGNDKQEGRNYRNKDIVKALKKIRNYWPKAMPILVFQGYLNPTLVPKARWDDFRNAIYGLAYEWDCPLIDQTFFLGDYANMVENGYNGDNQGHVVSEVHSLMGKAFGLALADGVS